jgi:hypothetical protein
MQRLALGLAMAFCVCTSALHAGEAQTSTQALSAKKASAPADAKPGAAQIAAGAKSPEAMAQDSRAELESKAIVPPKPAPVTWTDADVAVAKARCNALLRSVDAVVMPEEPFRSGSCGTPAPVRVISIGKDPEVALSPPPVLTCDMVTALATWIKSDVQPLARKHLGEPIIRIDTMSDYSCRAAYGRVGNRLSEHGRANALDIRGFVTSKGQLANVLGEWGKTQRDVKREIAAAKAAAERAEKDRAAAAAAADAVKAAAEQAHQAQAARSLPAKPSDAAPAANPVARAAASPLALSPETIASGALETVKGIVKNTIIDGAPSSHPPAPTGQALTGEAFGPPFQLGGPKDKDQALTTAALPNDTPAAVPISRKGRFLREAHAAACRIFGTTLGPEANEAHRNHLHVDMAERKGRKFCE